MADSAIPPIAIAVRERLSAPGLSMTELAKATGLSKRWLELMRAGAIPNPGAASIEKLASHFGCTVQLAPAHSDNTASAGQGA